MSFNGKGYHLWDFREKDGEVWEPVLSLAERLAIIKQQREVEAKVTRSLDPPLAGAMVHPQDWPLEARVWFYKAGINNDEIAALGAFWSPGMGRVVLPYVTLTGDRAWIARDPAWTSKANGTKYLFPQGAKRGGGALFNRMPYCPSGYVITEDALSAYRISRDTEMAAVAAQGTSLDRDALVKIIDEVSNCLGPVITWLDPDKYGQMGAQRIRKQLGNLGVEVRNIVSARDPKLHEPHEIREALET